MEAEVVMIRVFGYTLAAALRVFVAVEAFQNAVEALEDLVRVLPDHVGVFAGRGGVCRLRQMASDTGQILVDAAKKVAVNLEVLVTGEVDNSVFDNNWCGGETQAPVRFPTQYVYIPWLTAPDI